MLGSMAGQCQTMCHLRRNPLGEVADNLGVTGRLWGCEWDGDRRFKSAFPRPIQIGCPAGGWIALGISCQHYDFGPHFQWEIRKRRGGMTSCNIATSLMILNECKRLVTAVSNFRPAGNSSEESHQP